MTKTESLYYYYYYVLCKTNLQKEAKKKKEKNPNECFAVILDIDPSVFCQSVPELCHNTEPSDHNLTKKKLRKKKIMKKNYEKNTKYYN